MAKVRTQSQVKKKKKIWVQVNSPKLFGEMKIGETHVMTPSDAVGKTVNQNLMSLTGDMRKQNITMKFLIDSVKDNIAHTEITSYKMASSFIKRFVRRRRDKIEFSEVFTTKDNIKVRIKPLVITTNCTRGSTITALSKRTKALISARVAKVTFIELVEEIISYKFQMYMKNNLKKIHPLKNCEIRVLQKEKVKKSTDAKTEVKKEVKE